MSYAMVDLGEAEALPRDRRRAGLVAAVVLLAAALVVPFLTKPLGTSYPVFAITIALSISAIAITAVLLWAQAGVTRSFPLAILAFGYELTSIVMVPYLFFYPGVWPQLVHAVAPDTQPAGWLFVAWHATFICSAVAYYLARARERHGLDPPAFARLQRRLVVCGVAIVVVTVPPLIWLRGLPALAIDGTYTPLFLTLSYGLMAGSAAAIVLAYRMSRFRSVLDLWLAVACLSMLVDLTLQHFSRQFTAGWYASRFSIVLAASLVLSVLLFQTASVYGQLVATAERLRDESLTDVLTGLANRRAFDQQFAEVLRDCARTARPVAVLMIDIDNFKLFNDTFGHPAGDECLRVVATALKNSAGRARDVVARTGGEEMAVIMPEVDRNGALAVAERMRAAVEQAAIAQGPGAAHVFVTISIGAATTRDPANVSAVELVGAADRALYLAKDAGRNQVVAAVELRLVAGLPNV